MKKKQRSCLWELWLLQQFFPAAAKTKRQQRLPMKVWSPKIRREKPKTAMMRRKKKKEEEKETAAADKKVGVFLPSAADDSRWALDGESFQTALEGDGYDAEIFFADEDSDTQVSQIQSILDDEKKKTSALVIAPVDAYG